MNMHLLTYITVTAINFLLAERPFCTDVVPVSRAAVSFDWPDVVQLNYNEVNALSQTSTNAEHIDCPI